MDTLLGIVVFVLVGVPLIAFALAMAFTVLAEQVYLIGAFVLYLVGLPFTIVAAVMDRRNWWPAPDEQRQAKGREAWATLRSMYEEQAKGGHPYTLKCLDRVRAGRDPHTNRKMPDWMTGRTD
jgi:hypothetical protein